MQTDTKRRIPLAEAEALAAEVVTLLSPACTRIAVAGSIRRRVLAPGDIEIVAIPRFELRADVEHVGLFDTDELPQVSVNLLDELCSRLLVDGTFHGRLDKNGRAAIGPKYKRLIYREFALDLFVGTTANWGVLFAIRTGPAAFAHAFVTLRGQKTRTLYAGGAHVSRPGLLPIGMRVGEGNQLFGGDGRVIPTPEEEDFFRAINLPYVAPEQRR
jgi:DNA polymerase/3'-5' exonuclease PolX